MKTVKFRIWNGMEMVYDITSGKFGTFYVNPEKGDGLNPEDTASLTVNTTKYHEGTPLVQYVGINDANGKEIYEGDIVRFKSWRDAKQAMEERIMEVKYNNGFFIPFADGNNWRGYEVVGNVYENPQLLQKSGKMMELIGKKELLFFITIFLPRV